MITSSFELSSQKHKKGSFEGTGLLRQNLFGPEVEIPPRTVFSQRGRLVEGQRSPTLFGPDMLKDALKGRGFPNMENKGKSIDDSISNLHSPITCLASVLNVLLNGMI